MWKTLFQIKENDPDKYEAILCCVFSVCAIVAFIVLQGFLRPANAQGLTWDEFDPGLIEEDISVLADAQENTFALSGKYEYVPAFTVADNTYSVTEYVTPDGVPGYQVIIITGDGVIRSTGYGPEATSRTYETIQDDSCPGPGNPCLSFFGPGNTSL